MKSEPKKSVNKSLEYAPASIQEAWILLAANVLLFAIEDVRKNRNPEKRARAKEFLLTPAARFMFDTVMDIDFDLQTWILDDCPMMDKR